MSIEPATALEKGPPARIFAAMSGLVIAFLVANLDFTIVGTALPAIAGELGGLADLSLVVTSFALTTAVTTPIWGKLGDLYDRKNVFIAAFTIFLIGSALCGAARNMPQLIGFRALQGLGAGGLLVGGIAIVGVLFPPRQRAKVQGLMAIIMPLAIVSGPLIGGWCADSIGWRWAFYLNLPLGAVALILLVTQLRLPPSTRDSVRVDVVGMVALSVCIVGITVLASAASRTWALASLPVLLLSLATAVGAVFFLRWERRASDPVVPPQLFGRRNFTIAVVLGFLSVLVMFGAVTFLPLYQQIAQGRSATGSGLLMLPLLGGMLVVAPVVGAAASRSGRFRVYPVVGAAAMTLGMAVLASLDVDSGWLPVVAGMLATGAGMGCFMQLTVVIAQNSVGLDDIGAAGATAMLARNLGNSLGISLLGALYARHLSGLPELEHTDLTTLPEPVRHALRAPVTAGVTDAFLAAGLCAALAFVLACFLRDDLTDMEQR
ncbi:DHA2 family efflux MFS transporter permease subunit [Nocardia sp. GTS18]|uniref:DHA2 family efflux MFS transporter permease subunit n=1 Tax=Nocardia sp. GTS18 TaxID=1778064 RepID=UPI0015EE42EE|nr:DHA2 family efflux MFS transporter permease subunit [Nocardia sp. GTS18]